MFVLVMLIGLLSISLGIIGTFTFVSCGTITCINVYSLDMLAVVLGAILLFVGGLNWPEPCRERVNHPVARIFGFYESKLQRIVRGRCAG